MDAITISLAAVGIGATALASFIFQALSKWLKERKGREVVINVKLADGSIKVVHLPAGHRSEDVTKEIEKTLASDTP